MSDNTMIELYTDGGSRNNPGVSGIGVVAYRDGEELVAESRYVGIQTNNWAEYEGLIEGLTLLSKTLKSGSREATVLVHMDSELIVKQMKGEYRVKDPALQKQHSAVKALLPLFAKVSFTHILREKNARADALANEAMDRAR